MAHAKGDIQVGASAISVGTLPVNTDGFVLTLDSVQPLGVKWAAAPGAGGGGTIVQVMDLDCINMAITGTGTLVDPYIISAEPIIDPDVLNTLSCGPSGIFAATGLTFTNNDCIDVAITGDGTIADPFVLDINPIIDPSGTNILECTASGLYVPFTEVLVTDTASIDLSVSNIGQSYTISADLIPVDEHLLIASEGPVNIASNVPYTVVWSDLAFGGPPPFEQRGTDITWSIANPTRITFNTTGVYDFSYGTSVTTGGAATPPFAVEANIFLNGALDLRTLVSIVRYSVATAGESVSLSGSQNGWLMTAGDYIELQVNVIDAAASAIAGVFLDAAIEVTRRL